MTADHRHMSLSSLRRRPVLIAMLLYSAVYGAATFAVWREATSISNHRMCEKHYLVQGTAENAGGGETQALRMHGATRYFRI